ncbi:hypothetical protein N7466_007167 [Penicillium verhagenii]|uniref:uncharacterized protein n=1 Tax=Penicillium verhagenii TaxID=1562060 RepID=UPI00254507D2|nr:uncharacterized protein N7466_007167 [Penicillium verhagenii]KAJ5928211.1 hypothetical protein N7466_007167 [Penicillium verhagenii]
MPATDGLQPPLTEAERTVVKSYGGWTQFMLAFGLKPTDPVDAEEAKALLKGLADASN